MLIAFGTCNCLLELMKRQVDLACTTIKADYNGMQCYMYPLASVRDECNREMSIA